MLTRKRRVLVGAGSSLVWPAVTLLFPLGITFAAARVYAESAPPPPANCDAGVVLECADAGESSPCHSCTSGTCACAATTCNNGGTVDPKGKTCVDVPKCEDIKPDPPCDGKAMAAPCELGSGAPAKCLPGRATGCLPNDGGPAFVTSPLVCLQDNGASSSGGASSGSTSGTFIPGPDKVPGSSGAANTPASSNDDSGCATSSSTSIPLVATPIAIGLLLALRRRQPKKEPSARKRS